MKLLITDLDGTLYPKKDPDDILFLQNKSAIDNWLKAGNFFAVATSRGIGHYETICNKLNRKITYIGSNGAEIFFENSKKKIKTINGDIFLEICNLIKALNINASVTTIHDGHWLWSSKANYPIRNAKKKRESWNHIELIDLTTFNASLQLTQIKLLVPPEDRDAIKHLLDNKYNKILSILTSDCDAIDVSAIDATKGIAVKEICDYYKQKTENLIVIGDSENDIPMFKLTKKSYCIIGAESRVLQSATFSTNSVADVVKREIAQSKQ